MKARQNRSATKQGNEKGMKEGWLCNAKEERYKAGKGGRNGGRRARL